MEDRPENPTGQEDARRPSLAAAVQRLCFARWDRKPLDELTASALDDPIWESDPLAPLSEPAVAPGEAELPGWPEPDHAQVPTGRMRRLVGSSAAIVALGVALGAGFVSTGATADAVDPSVTDTTTVTTDTTATTTDT